mmetsp:Transcript_3956/g.8747  ORF Transcript_3956/g.8747 Transcript_3956/m.8747 type:complete len:101 (+) Transcript_3956:1852-2154(+)
MVGDFVGALVGQLEEENLVFIVKPTVGIQVFFTRQVLSKSHCASRILWVKSCSYLSPESCSRLLHGGRFDGMKKSSNQAFVTSSKYSTLTPRWQLDSRFP